MLSQIKASFIVNLKALQDGKLTKKLLKRKYGQLSFN